MKLKLPAFYKRYIRIIPGIKSYVLASFLVFVLGVIITLFSWYVDKQRIQAARDNRLNEQVTALRSDIVNRLSVYEQILRGASGLFSASDNVSAEEWRRFIQQFDVQNSYPGINAVGYVGYVPAAEAGDYVAFMRAQGNPDFTITPPGQRADYAPITFVETVPSRPTNQGFGYDIFSDPLRRQAANEATDSGNVSISEKMELLGNNNKNKSSFVMYAAVYDRDAQPKTPEERRANLRGFIFAAYRADNFFDKALDTSKFNAYSEVQVFDGETVDRKALLYETQDLASVSPRDFSEAYTFKLFDRNWTIRFAEPHQIPGSDSQRSNMILIGGITISTAIAGFLFLVMLTRARAIVYAKHKEAQQAKDDLLSLASHQLRTPATAVKQYLGMILEGYTGEIDKKQLPALQKAYSSNERQLDTINQILYVAKADAGRLSINRAYFDLNLLIDDISLELSDMIEANKQQIKIEHTRKRLKLYADEASIRMVIENLISNASKYSHPDTTITVKTGVKNDDAYVAIKDEGVGIAPDDFDKLFKKFSRIDNDLSLQVGGSGIGLYIDKVLIGLHGGRIEVASEIGKGSTFTVYIPRDTANNLTDGGQPTRSL